MSYPGVLTDATWKYLSTFAAWTANEMLSSTYMRIGNKPLLGLFNPSEINASSNALANWLAFVTDVEGILGESVCVIGYGATDNAAAKACKCNGTTNYGVLGGQPAGTGQKPWSTQVAVDAGLLSGPPLYNLLIYKVNCLIDQRPQKGPGGCAWSDVPAADDLVTAIKGALAEQPDIITIGEAVDELAEGGGGLTPTLQDGTYFVDLIGIARGQLSVSTFTSKIGATLDYIVPTGAWVKTTNVIGAYDTEEQRSSTIGDTLFLSRNNCTGFTIWGSLGPALGSFSVQVDGVTVATVSQVGSASVSQLLFTSAALSNATHTIQITVVSGPTQIDAIGWTWNP